MYPSDLLSWEMEPHGSLDQWDVFGHTIIPQWPVPHALSDEKTLLNAMKCELKENCIKMPFLYNYQNLRATPTIYN